MCEFKENFTRKYNFWTFSFFIEKLRQKIMKYTKATIILFLSALLACTANKHHRNSSKESNPIIITGEDYANHTKIDSKYTFETLDVSKITTLPTEGKNQLWDLRPYQLANHVREQTHDNHPVPAGTSFSTATFVRKHQSEFIKDFSYTEFYEVSDEGFYKLGIIVDEATANLGNGILLKSTGKEDILTPKDLIFKFPIYYGEKTNYEGFVVEEYTLTVSALGLVDAPVARKLTSTVQSEVVGWGKVVLPDAALDQTTEVLLVKNIETLKSNYFLNGQTAPAALLSMLGLKENYIDNMVFYNFISKEHGSIASISFDVDDTTKKIVFPAHFSSYKVEKHF